MLNKKYKKFGTHLVSVLAIWMLICIGLIGLYIESDRVIASGPTEISGIISTNTTWTAANSPYIITGNILIENEVTLIIKSGIEVKFDGYYYLNVEGSLIATGNENNLIIFTSNKITSNSNDWQYIRFGENSNVSRSVIEYCIIEYSQFGIYCYGSSPSLSNNVITNNGYGIRCQESCVSQIYNNNM